MTQAPNATTGSAAMRQTARTLIANTLAELVQEDQDWLGACRKRIKDRMSNAKHVIFNNEKRIALMLLGRTDEIPPLVVRNQQLERTAQVCALALEILDALGSGNDTASAWQPAAGAARRGPTARHRTAAPH